MVYSQLRAECLTPGSAPGSTLNKEYGKPLPFTVGQKNDYSLEFSVFFSLIQNPTRIVAVILKISGMFLCSDRHLG